MRLLVAIVIGKAVLYVCRLLHVGGGSSLPGVIALKIDPGLVEKISNRMADGAIVVTGTNGKTTTTKYLSDILNRAGKRVIGNRSGSNLLRGLASALIEQSTLRGAPRGDIGLFEVDEASMPEATSRIKPRIVVVTNLFRDQLDRYGELDKTAKIIADSIRSLAGASIFLNADDPLVAWLVFSVGEKSRIYFFGLDDYSGEPSKTIHSIDGMNCSVCGSRLDFERHHYDHLGVYACDTCRFKRPQLDYQADEVDLRGAEGSSFRITGGKETIAAALNLPGLHNVYNALAASAVALHAGISGDIVASALAESKTAFGRAESLIVDGKNVSILLVKNPVGLTQTVATIGPHARHILMILNDNFADGTDISWIWDADFSPLRRDARFILASGTRATDMALRLKYEGLDTDRIRAVEALGISFDEALAKTPSGETLYTLATYTGMLQLRNYLAKKGYVKEFWEPQL